MAISKVQNAVFGIDGGVDVSVNFPNTPTEGNLMIALCRGTQVATNASIPGWTQATSTESNDPDVEFIVLFYKVAGAGESKTVTLTWTSSTVVNMIIEEWTGLSATPLDQIANVNAIATEAASRSSGTTPTTTVADELCIAGFAMNNSVSAQSWSNSFTEEYDYNYLFLGSRIVSSTGTYETTLSWTTNRECGGLIATFKGAVTSAWTPKVIMVM